jgi:hypothetical protein
VVKPIQIRIISSPPGAEIRYGDAVLGRAPVNLSVAPMVAGHPVQARLAGHRDSQMFCRVTEVDVAAGEAQCEVSLKKLRKTPAKAAPLGAVAPKSGATKSKPKIHMID